MGNIFVNQSGVETQTRGITELANGGEVAGTTFVAQGAELSSTLDGAATNEALQLNAQVREAVDAACATIRNLCTFMDGAADDMGFVDRAESARYSNTPRDISPTPGIHWPESVG